MGKQMTPYTINVADLKAAGSALNIEITLTKPVQVRLWLAAKLVSVAVWLLGGTTNEASA